MTGTEKKQIYTMLNTVSDWLNEYSSFEENKSCPNLKDDLMPELKNEKPINSIQEEISAIENISSKIKNCTRCDLCKKRKNTVVGMGVQNPLVLIVGEGPGADEDESGLPFVGKAGQLLDKMLIAINLSRNTNCYIANIVKCRPPENRDPLPEEIEACSSYLAAQIAVLKPRMILALGRVAAQSLLNSSLGIGQLRGKILDYNGIPFMATYHPSALLRNEDLKRPAWIDLKVFREKLRELNPTYDSSFHSDNN